MSKFDGPVPVPDDSQLDAWLQDQIDEDFGELIYVLEDLKHSVNEKKKNGEPVNFAYGKLLNYLRSEEHWTDPQRIRMLAAALWNLANGPQI